MHHGAAARKGPCQADRGRAGGEDSRAALCCGGCLKLIATLRTQKNPKASLDWYEDNASWPKNDAARLCGSLEQAENQK